MCCQNGQIAYFRRILDPVLTSTRNLRMQPVSDGQDGVLDKQVTNVNEDCRLHQ